VGAPTRLPFLIDTSAMGLWVRRSCVRWRRVAVGRTRFIPIPTNHVGVVDRVRPFNSKRPQRERVLWTFTDAKGRPLPPGVSVRVVGGLSRSKAWTFTFIGRRVEVQAHLLAWSLYARRVRSARHTRPIASASMNPNRHRAADARRRGFVDQMAGIEAQVGGGDDRQRSRPYWHIWAAQNDRPDWTLVGVARSGNRGTVWGMALDEDEESR
jgi:hypothetical protein